MSDPTLHEVLTSPENRPQVIQDTVRLIDAEMASKRGLTAMPLKAGYKVIKGIRPGFVNQAVDFLLDDFCRSLEPIYQTWRVKDPRPSLHTELLADPSRSADALLGVTDRRAERSSHTTLKKLYAKLRPTAKKHVVDALPGLARTIEPYLNR